MDIPRNLPNFCQFIGQLYYSLALIVERLLMCLDVFVLAGQLKIRTSNSSSASEQSVFVNFDWSDALCPLNGAIKLSASIAIVGIEHCSLANDVFSHQNSENVPKDIELDPMQIQFLDVQVS